MQTQCPHCETRFRVTETQIATADGLVRCGACDQVFNIYEVADQASLDDEQQPLLYEAPTSKQIDEHSDTPVDDSVDSYADDQSFDISAERDSDPYTTDQSDAEQIAAADIDTLSVYDTDNIDEETLPDESEPIEPEKDTYNFFEDDEDSTGHVVPEEFRDSYQPDENSIASTVLWGIGILLLTATLFVEYAWFNRNKFTHIPEVQAEIEKLCQQLDCTNLSLRAPAKIELVTRNIYSHPNEKDVLLVNVTMKNNATFSQPYPVMKIDFSDVRGGIVASRNFLPHEYLAEEYLANEMDNSNNKPSLLLPDTSSSITMEIQDPGKQAMTYEFNFL